MEGFSGLAAWALQWLIYNGIDGNSAMACGFATALTYVPLLIINFMIQRKWIFKSSGLFRRFVIANLMIMALVTVLSPMCRYLIDLAVGFPWGDRGGFVIAALIGSVPSFLLKRTWVLDLGVVSFNMKRTKRGGFS